jgi:hypothetical protein
MKTKIIIATILLLLTIGLVAATTVDDFKVPNGYESKGNGAYLSKNPGEGILILEYNTENVNDFIDNDMVKIQKGSDNIMTYTDSELSQHGAMEVFEVDGAKFIVLFWAGDNVGASDNELEAGLSNFNKLNNIEPIAV